MLYSRRKGICLMHRIFKKEQVFTVPNFLSALRLLMIPFFVWLYCGMGNYNAAVLVLLLSGVTDVADGIIARKCNMVSDFGKILDPIADKLTQASVILCLAFRYKLMIAVIIVFILKEIIMGVLGLKTIIKTDIVNSSEWHGKLNTVALYAVFLVLILFPDINIKLANALICFNILLIIISLILYARRYLEMLKKAGKKSE